MGKITSMKDPLTQHESTGGRRVPAEALQAGLAFLAVGVVLFVLVAAVGAHSIEPKPLPPGFRWLAGWVRLDAGWYYSIASRGYFYTPGQQSSVAFFPTYPMAMRLLGNVVPSLYVAGVLITTLAGLCSAVVFWQWCSDRLPPRASMAALALLLLYPYSVFLYGAVYSDALFLAAALGAFFLLDRGHPYWAGLLAVAATAGRPVGVAVTVGLMVRAIELAAQREQPSGASQDSQRRWWSWLPAQAGEVIPKLRGSDFGVLLSASGLLGYCVYLWAKFGDPLAFANVQSAPGWQGTTGPRLWFKEALFTTLRDDTWRQFAPVLASVVVWLAAVGLTTRLPSQFGWGYTCYVALVIVIPAVGTKDFMGCGRFVLAAFPLFAVAGELVARLRQRLVLTALALGSAVGLVFGTFLYATGFQVA